MSPAVREASISSAPLSVDRLLGWWPTRSVGGIALFVGVVRDHDEGADVVSLDYTQHPSAPRHAAPAAPSRPPNGTTSSRSRSQHRVGHLEVGDLAVVVAVGAVHRGEALAACAHLIDTLKAEVPIWKEQRFASGDGPLGGSARGRRA